MKPRSLTIFLNGTVGAGKTATAGALARVLAEAGVPHAVIDADELRRSWPVPSGDRFNVEVELRNIASVSSNYRAGGVEVLVIAGVIEELAGRKRYAAAGGGDTFVLVRLTASAADRTARLKARHADDPAELAWHQHRTHELEAVLDDHPSEDELINTSGRTPREVAVEVWNRLGARRGGEAPPKV